MGVGGVGGILQVGHSSSYQVTAWNFERVASVVYMNPTGYRCVSALEHNLSRPNWLVLPDNNDPEAQPLDSHPLLDVLNQPSPKVSGTMMQRSIARDMELTGKSFWVKMRGRDGFGDMGPVTGLRRLPPQRVAVVGNEDDELLGFIYTDRAGNRMAALPDAIVYLRYPHPDRDYDGLAPAIVAGLPSETDNAAARFNYDLLANDGALPGYVVVNGLTPSEFDEWKMKWESGEYPGKTRFMSGNATYVKIGQSNKDMMQDMLRDYSQTDIQKAFGTPPAVVFDLSRETYANAEAEKAIFMQQTCMSKWTLWRDELSMQLGVDFGVKVGLNFDDIEELQEAEDAKVTRVVALVGAKILTKNEGRDELGYDGVDGGDEFAPDAPPVPPGGSEEEEEAEDPDDDPEAKGGPGKGQGTKEEKASPQQRWVEFNRRVQGWEGRVARKLEVFFGRQGRVIEARLRASGGKALAKAVDPTRWWDGERWRAELAQDSAEFLGDVVDTFGTEVMMSLSGAGPIQFDARQADIQEWITGRSTEMAGLVNETTEKALREVIAKAEAEGLGIDGIAARVREYFEDHSMARAELVARTEVIGAANFATLAAARQSGIAVGKTWVATADGRVDPDCADMDGKRVELDEDFGSVAHPPLHPNCRCTIIIETE